MLNKDSLPFMIKEETGNIKGDLSACVMITAQNTNSWSWMNPDANLIYGRKFNLTRFLVLHP